MLSRRTQLIIGGALLALVLFGLLVVPAAFKKAAPVPTPTLIPTEAPTAAPTKEPVRHMKCGGGDIFLKAAAPILLERYNIEVEIVPIKTFEFKTYPKLNELDCIWPGSAIAYLDFVNAHPGMIKDKEVVFRTFLQIMTRGDLFLPDLMKYGVVYVAPEGHNLMKMEIIINAMMKDWTWTQMFQDQATKLGITFVEKPWMSAPVNINYSNPTGSSGGLQELFLNANYLVPGFEHGGKVATVESITPYLDFLVKIQQNQDLQDLRSPDWWNTYRIKSGTYVLAASSESLYIGWYNSLSADKKATDGLKIVPIYPEWTVSTDHTLGGITSIGVELVKIFRNDKELQQLGEDLYGMRTAVGGIGTKPGNVDLKTIAADPQSVGEPQFPVYELLMAALKGK